MKPVCRTAVALGAAGLISLGALPGAGVEPFEPATAYAEESTEECSSSDFDLITKGHQDMALSGDSGDLSFTVKDDDKGVEHDSESFAIEVSDDLKQPLSELGDSSLPDEGWILPQTQDPDAPWLGFNTQELSQDLLATGDTANLSMAIAQGPEDGRILAYQVNLGDPKVLMDTADGSAWDYPGNSHSHPAFAFTEPGTYAVSFTFELPDGTRHHLHAGFLVGKQADAKDLCGVDYTDADAATGNGGDSNSRPKQLEKDVKDVDKAIAGLDKELDNTLQEGQKFLDGGKPQEDKKGSDEDSAGKRKQPSRTKEKDAGKDGAPHKTPSTGSAHASGTTRKSGAGSGATTHHSTSRVNDSASTAKSGKSGGAGTGSHRSASTSGSSHSTAKKSTGSRDAKSAKRTKGKAAGTAGAERVPDAGAAEGKNTGNVLTNAAAYTATLAKSSFWAGLLAGLGAFALVLGIGLLVYVQFFRKKKAPAQQPADNATAHLPRVD
ncbi:MULTISPECIES: choice-of-anchor M domain-containing protein [Corynebacterium]|uniref:choice-of-anchor M domain-containing protein n=1 Tax=Corynebacterium TaxID=1716 RepID=UPI001EF241B8|nr:choice-of-anchor M domain-containing protein [Corynebacterium kefirresidentii]MCG7241486.1 choice-of-anchor M domain-containing protein [Corynebacterium kefirresidentii]MCG7283669.1 choice-of-anchor M domain-containing protein [Corynebacterium kefirresidentii]MDK8837328.1 choice-of-anchor M domain-containing protein [Corynebacterium kefirresidentii]